MAKKVKGVLKLHSEPGVIVGAWISQEKMRELAISPGEFLYVSIGWSGSLSCRTVLRGPLPEGYDSDVIALTKDRFVEGNFQEGQVCKYWKHDNWN